MVETWRFKDEWLVRALAGVKGADQALPKFRADKKPYLSHALTDSGLLPVPQLAKLIELVFKAKHFPLSAEKVDKFALSLLKEKICRRYNILPVGLTETEMQVTGDNPLSMDTQADLEALTGRRVIMMYSLPLTIETCMAELFKADEVVYDLLSRIEAQDDIMVVGEETAVVREDLAVTSPIIALVNSIISQAYRKRSSDIHIEHDEKGSHVRIRIDGILKNVMSLPKHIATGPLVSRIKIMADLDVSNHLRPQDGRTKLRIGSAEVGLRVSVLPTAFGEKVVMRILDQRAAEVPFEKLGFAPEVAAGIEKCLKANQGILLVTGPTGSGKTTTLYSALNKTKQESTNIVTVEDPIEYKLAGINQVQINEKQGLTFPVVLRSVLRQDPDIIMVGEIRDSETADVAFQAAMTGHLVFSTLHTNDTISTISRLMDMGVDRFKISPGLLAITAQRLVRRLCPLCATKIPPEEVDKDILKAMTGYGLEPACYRGAGCRNCEGSGYAGRTSIVELLMVDSEVKNLINSGARVEELTKAATASKSLRTMTHDALWQLSKGKTDLAEITPYLLLKENEASQPAARPAAAAPTAPAPAKPAAAAPATQAAQAAPANGKPRVMIAEDDAIMRLLLNKFISDAGYEVLEAVDGEAALTAIAAGQPPDLLLSDINMPKMNGLELVKGLRETLGLAELPIIMLTTESSDKSQELAFKLGADDYIIKPFKAPLVIARINAALRRSGRIQ
ncbi:MAG TPA: ATPase, T2SS/T4P/T4SS family [Elusimicrobiales bacterium]|nr:ATPase, T2SS/T4P/T4SS family [Elusimicrobiales bacterium]